LGAFYFIQVGDQMNIADLISSDVKRQLNQIKSPEKIVKQKPKPMFKPKKEEKVNWHDMMDSNKRGLRRGKGGAWK
jgi:hypothetical protein